MLRKRVAAKRGMRRGRRVFRRRGVLAKRRAPNPRPIFTETYKAKVVQDISGGYGFAWSATMDGLNQLAQYSNLYQKYRILKAEWLLLPTWTGGENQNAAIYNSASGPSVPPGLTSVGTCRMVYAINNTPNQLPPVSEQVMLQDNGCRIRFVDKLVKIKHRPVPNIQDNNGEFITLPGKYLNFATGGNPNNPHWGVTGWISQPQSAGATGASQLQIDVYCKLTFQLADPR